MSSGKVNESDLWMDVILKYAKIAFKENMARLFGKVKSSEVPESGDKSGTVEVIMNENGLTLNI